MNNTLEAIVDASSLPISIVIVGIGQSDFRNMEILDSDNIKLTAPSGRQAERDIVQFVPFNTFLNPGNVAMSKLNLAREVLREIPDQLVGYMRSRNITPNTQRYE